jgi:hypothetical protein
VVVSLYELKNSPRKTKRKPTIGKKRKKYVKCQVELSAWESEGKNKVDKDSKGDSIVVATTDIRMDHTSIERSHRLEKKETVMDEIVTQRKLTEKESKRTL